MAGLWKNLKLQVKFTLVIGGGLIVLATLAVTAVSYVEFAGMQQRLQSLSARELKSLNSLVDSAMKMRLDDPQNVAIKVFNGWFESRNKEYGGKLWSVWGPKTTAYMARTAPQQAAKTARDAIDEEALRTGRPVGRFVGDTYRYSIPIVWGTSTVTKQEVCAGCHASAIRETDGSVVTVFSSSLRTGEEFAALRQHILLAAAGALAAIVLMLLAVWHIFGRVVARPFGKIAGVLNELTNDRIVDVPYTDRGDEVGDIAKATEMFKQSIAEKVINLRVRSGARRGAFERDDRRRRLQHHVHEQRP